MAAIAFSTAACTATAQSGGGKIVNNAEGLKEYLDSQPANSPDKPIKVAMNANDLMFKDIAAAITSAGKYVSLDLSSSPITAIPDNAFYDERTYKGCATLVGITLPKGVTSIGKGAFALCTSLASVTIGSGVTNIEQQAFGDCASLTSVTIPNSVTSIEWGAFSGCTSLTSVTFQGSIPWFSNDAFPGDLDARFYATDTANGTPGTYTTTAPVSESSKWTLQ